MGDPGVPMMAGLLAVPVAVLLFVAVLALMGRRWTSPAPIADLVPSEESAAPAFEDPWGYSAEPWPTPGPAFPPPHRQPRLALPPVREDRPALPPVQERPALPPVRGRRPALPPARPAYAASPDSYAPDPYAPDQYVTDPYRPDFYRPDPYRRPAEPAPDETSQQGFPYGPYRHQ